MNALLPLGAVAAGVVSVSSPCVLPVLPGYLSAVSAVDRRQTDRPSRPSIAGAAGFVAGFTLVFSALGATASALGDLLYSQLDLVIKVTGIGLVVLGLHGWGVLRIRALDREGRIDPQRAGTGPRRSILLGAVFALGWTPCIGPILATVLAKAATGTSLTQGVMLLMLYSLGLGLPFIALAVWFDRSQPARRWLARRGHLLERITATTLIVVGTGYLTGIWSTVFSSAQAWLARQGWPPI